MKFNPKYKITAVLAKKLLEIERHKEALHILPVTANLIVSLRETARLQSTHYSTQIEGNVLTQKEVKDVVDGKKGGFSGRERDEREVRNYFRALEFVEEHIKKDAEISEELIKQIHSLVLTGSKRKTPYREGQNVIKDGTTGSIVYMPPEAKDVKPLMSSLINWIQIEMNKNETPAAIIAGITHYQFATIHPYYDGNGRTARLLTTFILHKMGYGMKGIYSLEEYYAKNLQGYYDSLTIGNSHNYYFGRIDADITPFLDYFLNGMAISFKSVRKQAERLNELSTEKAIPFQMEKLRELRPQQKQVLSLFVKSKEASIQEIANHLGLNNRSTYGLVKKWIESDFIQIQNISKRARTYSLNKEWEKLIDSDLDITM